MNLLIRFIIVCGFIAGTPFVFYSFAQDEVAESEPDVTIENSQVVIPPLFEYVVAPDDLPDLQSRTDYLMDHFWDPFNFKSVNFVDQNALNHAFGVYVQAMQYASDKKIQESIKKLIGKIKGNPGLSYQFAKAAEENLYGPRAELWGDKVYIDFLDNVVGNKKVKAAQKKHFEEQLALLRTTSVGSPLPSLRLLTLDKTQATFVPVKEFTLLVFTPVECDEARYSGLKMDISGVLNDLIEEGRLEVKVIYLGDEIPAGSHPDKWSVYSSSDAKSLLDLRRQPDFYVVDSAGKIVGKNMAVDDAIGLLEYLSNNK